MITIAAKIINEYVPTNNLINSDIGTANFKKILVELAVNHSNHAINNGFYEDLYEFADGSKLSHDVVSFTVREYFDHDNMQLLTKGTNAMTYDNLVKELNKLANSHDEYGVGLDGVITCLEANCASVKDWCDKLDYYDFHEYHQCEVIYYANAIKFLVENDPSLRLSMELASNMGYETSSLNSEVLASLLQTDLAYETFTKFCGKAKNMIDDYLNGLED
jgi:hypothetical protein